MTTPFADRSRREYMPALDGLRGVAVTTVLLYHAGIPWMVGGYLGVSTFFTLSGFLITSLLLDEHEGTGRIRLAAFWERRLRRIMPAAIAGLCLALSYGWFAADAYQRDHLRGDVLATLAYLLNWWFVVTGRDYVGIVGSPSPVQHFWSLAIEEQFYLGFPVLTAFVLHSTHGSRRALGAVLAAMVVLSLAVMLMLVRRDAPFARMYYGTDTRIVELLAGALLALALRGDARVPTVRAGAVLGALGVLGLAVSAYFWTRVPAEDARLYRGGLACYALASVMVVAAAAAPSGPVRRVLAVAPLRWLGRVSYGVYLYHFPIYLWLTPARTGLGEWPLLGLRVAVALLAAATSHRWLEWPIRTGRRVLGWRRWAAPPLAAGAVAVACLVVTTRAATDAVGGTPVTAGGDTILVVGDSFAAGAGVARDQTLSAHLERMLAARHADRPIRVVNLGAPGMNSSYVANGLDRDIATYAPRLVIVWVGVRNLTEPTRAAPREGALGDALRRLLGLAGAEPSPGTSRPQSVAQAARDLATDLERIAATARTRKTALVLVNYPLPHYGLNEVIDGAGERLGIPVVRSADDVSRAMEDGHTQDQLLTHFAGRHPTGLLYRYVAESSLPLAEAALD